MREVHFENQDITMTDRNKAFWLFSIVFRVGLTIGGIISSTPGVQRCPQNANCTLRWSVTVTSVTYTVYNQTTGTASAIGPRGIVVLDQSTAGIIAFTVTNTALWDGGNYTLVVISNTAMEGSVAVLYVYGYVQTSVAQTSGRKPPIEGDNVELTCSVQSTSVSLAYQPRLVITWYLYGVGYSIQILSNGTVLSPYGDVLYRYTAKNDGRILAIASVQFWDYQSYGCRAMEDGSPYSSGYISLFLNLQYRPVITSTSPPSRRYNALVGESVQLLVSVSANPSVIPPYNNWTFTNTQGYAVTFPENSTTTWAPSLTFTLASASYYGTYTLSVTNTIGTTFVGFQVLPPGPPDTPLIGINYVTHASISVFWTCMASNFNSRAVTVYVLLKDTTGTTTIGTYINTLPGSYFNQTYTTLFNSNIQPETSYIISVNSTNERGSSDIATINVKTTKVFQFIVTPDSIQIIWPWALINFVIANGNTSRIYVTCCTEITVACAGQYFLINGTAGQVNMSISSIRNYTEYVFDFTLYVGKSYDTLGSLKGIRVNTTISASTPADYTNTEFATSKEWQIATIVLAVLLGIVLFSSLIGLGIGFGVWKRRHQNRSPYETPQIQGNRMGTITSEPDYEMMQEHKKEAPVYTALE